MCTVLADNSRRGRKRVGRTGRIGVEESGARMQNCVGEAGFMWRLAMRGGTRCRVRAEVQTGVVQCGGIPRIVYLGQMVNGARAACLGGWSMDARGEENE
jgi:hypothetical protein